MNRRNRGRGRGRRRRGGRGRGRGRGAPAQQPQPEQPVVDVPPVNFDEEMVDDEKQDIPIYTSQSIREQLFLKEAKIQQHIDALQQNSEMYLRELRSMIATKVSLSFTVATKARILGACFIVRENDTVATLLNMPSFCSLAEVVKCVQILDAPRKARQYKKKLKILETLKEKNDKAVRQKTIAELRTHIHNLSSEPHKGSFSGARQRRIRKWIKTIPKSQLEFFILNYPTDSWRALADIIHVKPTDFQLAYFQGLCFGEDPPAHSLVANAKSVNKDNLNRLLDDFPDLSFCYSYIRKQCKDQSAEKKREDDDLTTVMNMGFSRHQAQCGLRFAPRYGNRAQNAVEWIFDNPPRIAAEPVQPDGQDEISAHAKAILARRAPLETLIWWYHELQCPEAENIILQRLADGEALVSDQSNYGINYGKLMERLLWFREKGIKFSDALLPHAEELLKNINARPRHQLNIAVMGDASGSMEVAIKSATIIGSLLSCALNADLVFFNEDPFNPPCVPRIATEVIQVVEAVAARGGTSMAAALWPYYQSKKSLDLIVLVSDEGENEKCQDLWFSELFHRYRNEISPDCKIFLVSFLAVGDQGTINTRLIEQGIEAKQFRLDPNLPDTSKFDSLLGQVVLETNYFTERWEVLEYFVMKLYGCPKSIAEIIMSYN